MVNAQYAKEVEKNKKIDLRLAKDMAEKAKESILIGRIVRRPGYVCGATEQD